MIWAFLLRSLTLSGIARFLFGSSLFGVSLHHCHHISARSTAMPGQQALGSDSRSHDAKGCRIRQRTFRGVSACRSLATWLGKRRRHQSVRQPILIQSYGWAPGTNGRKAIPLLGATIAANGKPSVDAAKLKGSAVLVDFTTGADTSTSPNYVVRRSSIAKELAGVGATAMLIQSDKPGRMLYTSAAGLYPGAPLPMLSVEKEDALFLRRLLSKGDVRLELDVQNSLDASPSKERNVVAELTGTSPQEIVLLGAHSIRGTLHQVRTTTVPESWPSWKAHVFSNRSASRRRPRFASPFFR